MEFPKFYHPHQEHQIFITSNRFPNFELKLSISAIWILILKTCLMIPTCLTPVALLPTSVSPEELCTPIIPDEDVDMAITYLWVMHLLHYTAATTNNLWQQASKRDGKDPTDNTLRRHRDGTRTMGRITQWRQRGMMTHLFANMRGFFFVFFLSPSLAQSKSSIFLVAMCYSALAKLICSNACWTWTGPFRTWTDHH